MKEMKRIVALVLCLVMLVGYLPVGAHADEVAPVQEPSAITDVVVEEAAAEAEENDEESLTPDTGDPAPADEEAVSEENTTSEEEAPAAGEAVEEETPAEDETVEEETPAAEEATEEAAAFVLEEVTFVAPVTNAGNLIDAAIFCSDVHGSSSAVSSAFTGIKNADSTFNPSTATFVGDTQMTASSVTSAAQSVYSDVGCYYAYGNHDSEGNYGISDVTGLLYGDSSTNYYIYAISQTSMASSSPDTSGFTSTVAGLDKTKPLFIASHLPLHDRRGDSNGAAAWYEAISAAAESMDIVFFWAHNHTGENDVDRAAFYVEKNGDETITLENTSTVVTPNFTYMNAGFVGMSSSRGGVVTTVKIYDDSLVFQDYTSSGTFDGEYSHNVTVAREFAGSTDSGETTDPDEGGTTTTYNYTATASTDGTGYILVSNGYALQNNNGTMSAVAVTVSDDGSTITFADSVDVSTILWTIDSDGDVMNGNYYLLRASGSGTKSMTIGTNDTGDAYSNWTYSNDTLTTTGGSGGTTTFYAYCADGTFSTQSSSSQELKFYVPSTTSGGGSGDDNTGSGDSGNTGDGEDDTTTGGSTETVVGEATVNTATDNSWQTVTFGTEGEKKTLYVLVDSITSGEEYLIVNTNSTGTGYGLGNSTAGDHAVTITSGNLTVNGTSGTYTYIEDKGDALEWTATGSNSSVTFASGDYKLGTSGSGGNRKLTVSSSSSWVFTGSALYYDGQNDYYVAYSSGSWGISSNSTSSRHAYLYQKVDIDTSSSVTYSVTASDINHVYDEDATTAETAKIEASTNKAENVTFTYEVLADESNIIAKNEDGTYNIASDGTVTLTGAEGTAKVKVSYSWTEGENTYTIWKVINVTASAPYYTIELCEPVKVDGNTTYEPITEPVALKGKNAGDTYAVWAVVKYFDGTSTDGTDLGDVEDDRLHWTVSDTSIATINPATGEITFTGNKYGTFDVTVYYLDENGEVLCEDVITISATESQYVVPGDGTNDFPEYPDQGAIRFDKTAVAQGNFSQTGIAKVELSMTGVPYGTNAKTDVVVMVDMTASMNDNDVTAAESAVKELIESLTYDEENDKYDSNIQLFVDVFYSASSDSSFETEEYLNCVTISNATELAAAKAKIDFTQSSQGGGTRYNLAMKDVYETLNREGHADNQYAIFVSDGVPTAYAPLTNGTLGTTITGSNSEDSSLADGWFDLETGAVTDSFQTEYYSYLIKTAGIPLYTVGCNLTALTEPALVLDHMSSNYSPDGKTATGETKYSFFCTTSGGITDEVLEIFHGIGTDIREAATNVVVEDKIESHYTVNFSLPSGVTAAEAGMDDFYIQVLGYTLDENNDREDNPTVLEKFLFNSDGTITHTIGATTCADCNHVTKSGDKVTGIDGTYFDYKIDANGDEFLVWTADKLDRTELALEYFVYLDNSAGNVSATNQVKPGTYNTNEYATITYTNFNRKECQQYFPIPSMTWMGAQVTYVFYLVNENGQPVNRAGKIVPFAESIYVTDPVTIDVTWNELEGSENMLAEDLLATAKVPEVYSLYDSEAYYEIRVYQTEGVDSTSQARNYNYFIIEGSDSVSSKETTKVFNTKAGNRYDDYGAYSATAGTYTSHNSNMAYTATVTTGIDYANTTVAFAVVWKPELVPDTVVVDYGLDVVIDVTTNDALASGVTGVSTQKPDVAINSGTYDASVMKDSADIMINDLIVGTAKKENLTSVRFSLNKSSGMQFSEPVDFYYESECNYYTYDSAGNRTLNTTHMYSSVTVIPATTIYYEDEFVTLTSETKGADGKWVQDENSAWTTEGSKVNATQAQDRPGESQISAAIDADNNYGYDAAYSSMSQYSLGSAAKVNVYSGHRAKATFEFYGTGFDVISLTSNKTGTIAVSAYAWDDATSSYSTEIYKSYTVDTYYGYTKNDSGVWEPVDSNDPNALYQVPVMKLSGMPYGKYKVEIVAAYAEMFDHDQYTDNSYDFYLDAIRIYDPTGNQDETANDAYVDDGEGWPTYYEVRNKIIEAKTFESVETDAVNGIVFIDGAPENASVSDYTSYGPNNETYLDVGQAIAFELSDSAVAEIQLAVKTVGGNASVKVYSTDGVTALDEEITTATDMYYDITAMNGKTVIIMNDGESGILSITNVKITHTEAPAAGAKFMLRRSSVDAALATMNVEEEVPETTEPSIPETTEPAETEPSVPETTEPAETEPSVPETTEPEETTPTVPGSGTNGSVNGLVNTLKNVLKNLLGRWFR